MNGLETGARQLGTRIALAFFLIPSIRSNAWVMTEVQANFHGGSATQLKHNTL